MRPLKYNLDMATVAFRNGYFCLGEYRILPIDVISCAVVPARLRDALDASTFVHDGLALDRSRLQPGEKLTVTLTVCNTGTRSGSEVVQL